jgi:hypothetical protein
METIEMLALAFATKLRAEIGDENLAEVVRRNALPEYACACASHDFCDANMPMAAAFEEITGREPDVSSEEDCALWNAAWDAAKARRFAA